MPFVYRLEKILKFRIQKKDEQLEVVKAQEQEVRRIQGEIDKNNEMIKGTRENMRIAEAIMMESYDNYLQHLYEVDEKLQEELKQAKEKLEEEKEKLRELEKGVKVLEKHKEKKHEEYKEEEKYLEMKNLNEVGSLKHFRAKQERIAEEEQEEALIKKLEEEYENER